jgi:hypothetical protein
MIQSLIFKKAYMILIIGSTEYIRSKICKKFEELEINYIDNE